MRSAYGNWDWRFDGLRPPSSEHFDYGFATGVPFAESAYRGWRFAEWVGAVNDRRHFSRLEHLLQDLQVVPVYEPDGRAEPLAAHESHDLRPRLATDAQHLPLTFTANDHQH